MRGLLVLLLLLLSLQTLTCKKAANTGKLQVLSFTPGTPEDVFTISEKTAITVVFNRAVIPLGEDWGKQVLPARYSPFVFSPSEPPGLFRWVTTSIGVFYPEKSWPTDLLFNVTINKDLVSFDNLKPDASTLKVYRFETPKLKVSHASASSRRASQLTANNWNSNQQVEFPNNTKSDRAHPEVPTDGFLQIYFTQEINVKEFTQQLRVEFVSSHAPRPKTTVPSIRLHNCTSNRALNISFTSPLARATQYQIVIPAGSKYSPLSGPISADLKIPFYGLHFFRFTFKTPSPWELYEPDNLFSLNLQHGLSNDTDLEEMKKSIQFNPPVAFRLQRPNLATLQISGDFVYGASYDIIVSDNKNVKDGFGGRLYGSKGSFKMRVKVEPRPYFVAATSTSERILLHETFDMPWKYLTSFGDTCDQPALEVQNVDGNVLGALFSLSGYQSKKVLFRATEIPMCSKGVVDVNTTFFGASNTFAISERIPTSSEYRNTYSVSRTSLAATVFTSESETLVWVTSTESNEPVKDVIVKAFGSTGNVAQQSSTDEQGMASLDKINGKIIIVLEKDGRVVPMPDTFYVNKRVSLPLNRNSAVVIADRKLYLPGDKVNMKIYFMQPINPSKEKFELSVDLMDQSRKYFTVQTPFIVTNSSLGTGTATLEIPSQTFFSNYYVNLKSVTENKNAPVQAFGSVNIQVAEPRIPTVTTTLTSAKKVINQRGVEISFSSRFYFGNPLADYPVKITWEKDNGAFSNGWRSLTWWNWRTVMPEEVTGLDWVTKLADKKGTSDDEKQNDEKNAELSTSGVMELKTDVDGKMTHDFKTPKGVNNGDTINLVSKLMSPTGELLEQKISLPVQSSEWSITVSSTSREVVPGHTIAFYAKPNSVGSAVPPTTMIRGVIYKWNKEKITENMLNNKSSDLNKNRIIHTCSFKASQSIHPQCLFRVPQKGNYVAVFSVKDTEGQMVYTGYPFGKNAEEWEREPLFSLKGISITLNDTKFSIGQVASVDFLSPFASAMMLIKWGNQKKTRTQVIQLNETSINKFTHFPLTIGEECIGGCVFGIAVHAPRQPSTFVPKMPVPISPIFDWSSPLSMTQVIHPEIVEKEDCIIIKTTGQEAAAPGETVSFDISLTDEQGLPTDAELTVMVVDQSILDLAPPTTVNLKDQLKQQREQTEMQMYSSNAALVTKSTYERTFALLQEKLKNNPKFFPSWQLKSTWMSDPWLNFNASAVDPPTTTFLTLYSSGNFNGGPILNVGRPMALAMEKSFSSADRLSTMNMKSSSSYAANTNNINSAAAPSSSSSVDLRSDVVFCPYFNPNIITTDGKANFEFQLPDNIGQFAIKVFARNIKLAGNAETKIKSRKPLVNLLPVAPRMVRYDDAFQSGVSLSVTDPKWQGGLTVSLLMTDCDLLALSLDNNITWNRDTNIISQKVMISPNTPPSRVLFTFFAIKQGDVVLRYTVSFDDQSIDYDSLQVTFPIEGLQENVYIGTSFSISQSSSEKTDATSTPATGNEENGEVSEGLKLPASVPGSGTLLMSTGVGRLPSVQLFVGRLADKIISSDNRKRENIFRPSGHDLLSNLIGKYLLRKYKSPSAGLLNRTDLAFDRSLASLAAYTSDQYGLLWFPPLDTDRYESSTNYVNEYLNSYGLIINRILISIGAPELPKSLTTAWEKALLSSFALRQKEKRSVVSSDLLAMMSLATSKLPPNHMTNLTSKPENLPTSAKLYVSWKLFADKTNVKLAKQLFDMVAMKVRVQGRTAYVSTSPTSSTADVTATTLFLYITTLFQPKYPLLDKIANYVAQGGRSGAGYSGFSFFGNEQSIYAILGLTTYDISRSNTNPDVALRVTIGDDVPLMNAKFNDQKTVDEFKTTFDAVAEKATSDRTLHFTATGQGEVSVAVGLDFCPDMISPTAINRGISLTKIYQLADVITGQPTGKPLTKFEIGQEVIVTIEITLLDDVSNLMIVDPLPAGLEASEKESMKMARCFVPYSFFSCSYFWMPYFTREVRKDKVRFFASNVYAGTHSVSYKAVVVTEGQFVIPPVKGEDMVHPETMGLSAGGEIITTKVISSESRINICDDTNLDE